MTMTSETVSNSEVSTPVPAIHGVAISEHCLANHHCALFLLRLPVKSKDDLVERLSASVLTQKYSSIAGAILIHVPELAEREALRTQPDLALAQMVPGLIFSSAARDDILDAGKALLLIVGLSTPEARKTLEADLAAAPPASPAKKTARELASLWAKAFRAGDAPSS